MAKITVKIPHIVWRDSRPRFVPGPALRKLGYRGEDLKHPDGRWFDLNETARWSEKICKEVETSRQQQKLRQSGRKPIRNHARKGYISVGELLSKWHRERVKEGKQTGKPKQRTLDDYDYNIRLFQAYDPELWTVPAASITDVMANGIYKKLREAKGISMSKAIISTLRPAWHWAQKEMGLVTINPWRDLRMTTPPPRLRVGSITEMKHLISTADRQGRPDVGDAIMLGLCTGQRQADRLHLELESLQDDGIIFRQRKTGVRIEVPAIEPLKRRLKAAKARRELKHRKIRTILFDETKGRDWTGDKGFRYRRAFRPIRNMAAKSMPSLEGFTDQDLRDTAVTWLANAGCTDAQISSITGHEPENIARIMKHYRARTREQAKAGTDKLDAYIKANGGL